MFRGEKEKVSLAAIEEAASKVLNEIIHMELKHGIRTPWNNPEVVLCRTCYYQIAKLSGHNMTKATKRIGQAPSAATRALVREIKNKEVYEKIKSIISGNEPDVRSTA